jgi:hypothetical protein
VLSPPFPLPSAVSPPADVATPPHHVTLPSHAAKMSSLHLLHLLAMFHHITSLSSWNWSIESAPPLPTTLPRQADSHNLGHSSHYSTVSPFCFLPSQSTTLSELHPLSSFPFTTVSRPSSLHCRPYFVSQTAHRHVNSRKNKSWSPAAVRRVIN